jgi:hypothetical protein
MTTFTKDPAAHLDYALDWNTWLEDGEAITASTWETPDGITEATPAPTHGDGRTVIWLSGGTPGQLYRVTNRVTTTAGRTDERSLSIRCTHR